MSVRRQFELCRFLMANQIIAIIAAMAENRVIGMHNRLPWKLPVDMRWFVKQTKGKPIVMGRKTYESFGARPLKDRLNIVVSRNPDYPANGAALAGSLDQALRLAQQQESAEIMVIGGASFYEQALASALVQRMYLTRVAAAPAGDAWFPDFSMLDWRVVYEEQVEHDQANSYDCVFQILERV